MELKEAYKNGATCMTKLFGVVKVVNDESQFPLYKKMGLDVFKNDEDRKQEEEDKKALKELERVEKQRLEYRAIAQKEKKAKAEKIAKDLRNAEKASKKIEEKK